MVSNHLKYLIDQRGFAITGLARARFLLEKAMREKIKVCRLTAYEKGYQHTLFDAGARVETSSKYAFTGSTPHINSICIQNQNIAVNPLK